KTAATAIHRSRTMVSTSWAMLRGLSNALRCPSLFFTRVVVAEFGARPTFARSNANAAPSSDGALLQLQMDVAAGTPDTPSRSAVGPGAQPVNSCLVSDRCLPSRQSRVHRRDIGMRKRLR